MKAIDIASELSRFAKHLESNPRTIFSAKFGDGKTYFLNEYIAQHKENTLFIVLHPINYSVATNEDIFEYIKRDILVELSKEKDFKEIDWKEVAETLFGYDTILEECEKLSDVLPPTKALLLPFRLFKKVDDKYAIDKYFNRFAEMKGSIYEQDQYTAAIKATIEKIKNNGRKCVLIIEDLDRIDPKHIFRILNVLGAHIDEDNNMNKFGFDNTIAILDYYTTKQIFHHFYGREANYDGFMAKFTSHSIFEYSITREAQKNLLKYFHEECKLKDNDLTYGWHSDERYGPHSIKEIIGKLSVRDIVKVLDDIEYQYETNSVNIGGYIINPHEPIVKLFAILTRLNIKIETKRVIEFLHQSAEHYSLLGAFVLTEPTLIRKTLVFSDREISFTPQTESNNITSVKINLIIGGNIETYQDKTAIILTEVLKCVHDCIPIDKI